MKKIFYLLATAFMAVACFGNKQVQITGNTGSDLKELGDVIVVFSQQLAQNPEVVSAPVQPDGTFTATITGNKKDLYKVSIASNGSVIYGNAGSIIPDSKEIEIRFLAGSCVVNGSKLTDRLHDFAKADDSIDEKYNVLLKEALIDTMSIEERDAVQKKILNEKALEIYKTRVAVNGDNYIGFKYFIKCIEENIIANYATYSKFSGKVSNSFNTIFDFDELEKLFKGQDATDVGKKFKNVQGVSLSGEKTQLSDFAGKGKYTLVSFWTDKASVADIPYIDVLRDQYIDKLNVVGITDTESDKSILDTYEIHWDQIIVPANVNLQYEYGFNTNPYIILIDPKGTIVKRGMSGVNILTKTIDLLNQ